MAIKRLINRSKLLTFSLMKSKVFNFLFSVLLISCNPKKAETHLQNQFPEGKFQAFKLQNNDSTILFDPQKNYTVTFENQKKLTITAEDNVMHCDISKLPGSRPKIDMISKTDVCCNSKTADALFDFFGNYLQITQQNNKLILSSEKGVLELKHFIE